MNYSLLTYDDTHLSEWNDFLPKARQQCMLFNRSYMDYHRKRFKDASLIFVDTGGRTAAILPACVHPAEADCIGSHSGLTFGGILTRHDISAAAILEMLDAAASHYAKLGYKRLSIRRIPYIYNILPSDEDLYWLFRRGAHLTARSLSTAIDLHVPEPMSTLRSRKVKKALHVSPPLQTKSGIEYLPEYWNVLEQVLLQRHGTRPTHTLSEMQQLMLSNPDSIELRVAVSNDSDGNEGVVAGIVIYKSRTVAHLQYIAASDEGCRLCALDYLISQCISDWVAEAQNGPLRYLDFGVSTEQGGLVLNHGLQFQKEGFGARSIAYDTYELPLIP